MPAINPARYVGYGMILVDMLRREYKLGEPQAASCSSGSSVRAAYPNL